MLNVLVVPWATTFRVKPVPRKLIVLPFRPSAALNWIDARPTLNTSVLPAPDSPKTVTVPPVPANPSVAPPGIERTNVPPRLTFKMVLPKAGDTAYWSPAELWNTRSPSQGLNVTLPTAFAPVPAGFVALVGPVTLPHQLSVALTDPADWLFCTPVVLPAKLSLVAVRVAMSEGPDPTAMPVVLPVTLLSVIVAAPPAVTAMPVAKPVIDIAVMASDPPLSVMPVPVPEPMSVRPESVAVTPGSTRKTPLVPPLKVRPAAGPVMVVASAVLLSSSGAPARVMVAGVVKAAGSNEIAAPANWL